MIQLKVLLGISLFILLFLLTGCISLQRGIHSKLYLTSSNLAVYKLEKSPIDVSTAEIANRIQVEDALIQTILFTIRKEISILKIVGKETLWDLGTVEELIPVVKDILSSVNKGKTFFVVVKEEDTLSPYARIFRSTLYINRDGNILQLIFGEVNNNINFGMQFSFQDWANPSYFKISCEKKKVLAFEGRLDSSFQFKKDSSCEDKSILPSKSLDSKLESLNNYKWILIDLEKATLIDKEKKSDSEKGNRKTRENRLKELMDLYKKGLINKEDYEIKKAEVLSEL